MPTIRTVSIDELDRLGIDENNKLYWSGKPLIVEEKVSLQWWLNLSAVAASVATVVTAAVEVLKYVGGLP